MFLEIPRDLRSIILQDLALLVDKVPKSIYSQYWITTDPLFVQFKEERRKKAGEDAVFTEKHMVLGTEKSDFGDWFKVMNSVAGNTKEKQSENSVEQEVKFQNLKYRIPNFILPKIRNEVRSEVTKDLEIQNKEYKSALKKAQELKQQLKDTI